MTPEPDLALEREFHDMIGAVVMSARDAEIAPRTICRVLRQHYDAQLSSLVAIGLGRKVLEATAAYARIGADEIRGPGHEWRVSHPRQVAMAALYDLAGLSAPQIGAICDRDHTTVLHARQAVSRRLDEACDETHRLYNLVSGFIHGNLEAIRNGEEALADAG